MKRSDIWWAAAYGLLAVFTVLFCVTGGFAKVNTAYPYLAGFAQFAVYATAGELLSGRLLEGTWQINRATWFKSLSWGIERLCAGRQGQGCKQSGNKMFLHDD